MSSILTQTVGQNQQAYHPLSFFGIFHYNWHIHGVFKFEIIRKILEEEQ